MMIAGGSIAALKELEIGPFEASEVADGEINQTVAHKKPPSFIAMEPILIPVIIRNKVAITYRIEIKLETYGQDNQEILLHLKTKLNDIFIRDLHAFIPRLFRKKKELDVIIVKKRLELIASRSTSPGLITGVLVQSITNN